MSPVPTYSEFSDPRLVAIYDTFNALGQDSDFFVERVKEAGAVSILDFGCGTGLLTCELAKLAYQMTGIDPSNAMLDIARQKPYGERVNWIQGSSEQLHGLNADVMLMTSHVAQFFLDDAEWLALLQAARHLLKAGGRLIFDSRNPLSKLWDKWTRETSSKRADTLNGPVEVWYQLMDVDDSCVLYEIHYLFEQTNEALVSINQLIYRSQEQLSHSLSKAGFAVKHVYGNWDGSSFASDSPEMIFVAD